MSDQSPIPGAYDGIDRRMGVRRRVTRRVDISLRRGTLGLTPNLAIALVDVSEEGMGVRLTEALDPGAEVEIVLSFPIVSKSLKLLGEVCWCNSGPYETFLAGVRLRRRLTHLELAELC
jgi:c-di-GMP-binding flagellar brake protein YcgR